MYWNCESDAVDSMYRFITEIDDNTKLQINVMIALFSLIFELISICIIDTQTVCSLLFIPFF